LAADYTNWLAGAFESWVQIWVQTRKFVGCKINYHKSLCVHFPAVSMLYAS